MSANSSSSAPEKVERDRPDLSSDYRHPQDPDTPEPYLAIHSRDVPLPSGGDALVLELIGELDLVSTPNAFHPLAERALSELATRPAAVFAVDLSGVEFIDSAGLKEMVELKRRTIDLPTIRLMVAVGGPKSQVQRVWNLGQFQTFITSRPTLVEVLALAADHLAAPETPDGGALQ